MGSIAVIGGNGFLGREICLAAVRKNLQVTSISRRGEPEWRSSNGRPSWADRVEWRRGDALKPETYEQHLKGCNAVVHTTGILLELDYKDFVNDPLGSLKNMTRGKSSSSAAPHLTYEQANRDAGK